MGPYFMLLSQELGKFPIATHSFLRQAWARPLHQHKVVLVDRSRWHLWRMKLAGTAHLGSVIIPAHHSISCVGSPLNSHCPTQQNHLLGTLSVLPCAGPALWLGTGDAAANGQSQALQHTAVMLAHKRLAGELKVRRWHGIQ